MGNVADGLVREWRRLGRTATWKDLIPPLAGVLLLGALIPSLLGFGFLDPYVQLLYACLGPFFLVRPLIGAYSDDLDRRILAGHSEGPVRPEALLWAKTLVVAALGWAVALAVQAAGLAVVSLRYGSGHLVAPEARFLAGVALTGAAVSFFGAAVGARFALGSRQSVGAKLAMRRLFLFVLLGLVTATRLLPESQKSAYAELLMAERALRNGALAAVVFLASGALILRYTWRRLQAAALSR